MIERFQDPEFKELLKVLDDNEIVTVLNDPNRANQFINILRPLKDKTKSEKIKKAFDLVLNSSIPDLQSKKTYQTIKNLL